MKVLDIIESSDLDWLDKQIDELSQSIKYFNNLVEIKGYNQASKESQESIDLSKSADWFYEMLAQTDNTIKSKYSRMLNVRNNLEQLVNNGLSYE